MSGLAADNLYVTDLPADFDNETVSAIFSSYGTVVSVKVLPPKVAGQAMNAMVRVASAEEAQWIVENLNGNIPEGLNTPIGVKFANSGGASKGDKGGKGSKGGPYQAPYQPAYQPAYQVAGKNGKGKSGGKGGKASSFSQLLGSLIKAGLLPGEKLPVENQLYVKGLPADTTDECLFKLFCAFGAISPRGVKAMKGPDGVSCNGIGFVDFLDPVNASIAQQNLDQVELPDGSVLEVRTKAPSTKKADGKDGKGKGGKKGKGKW